MHTETTVQDLEASTTRLGQVLRDFQRNVCEKLGETYDLPSEEAARGRRRAAAAEKRKGGKRNLATASESKNTSKSTRRPRTFQLNTVKFHSLGGYAKAIRLHGTTDNYSTQTVS